MNFCQPFASQSKSTLLRPSSFGSQRRANRGPVLRSPLETRGREISSNGRNPRPCSLRDNTRSSFFALGAAVRCRWTGEIWPRPRGRLRAGRTYSPGGGESFDTGIRLRYSYRGAERTEDGYSRRGRRRNGLRQPEAVDRQRRDPVSLRRFDVSFWLWVVVGVGLGFGISVIGLVTIPASALVAIVLLSRPRLRASAYGVLVGIGIPLLAVTYMNREGPRTSATRSTQVAVFSATISTTTQVGCYRPRVRRGRTARSDVRVRPPSVSRVTSAR